MSVFIVQHISTWWTKASRGAPMAGVRNAVPERANVPKLKEKDFSSVIHTIRHDERTNFIPEEKLFTDVVFEAVRGISIQKTGDGASVDYAYTLDCGQPERGWMKKRLTAPTDQWLSIMTNGRFLLGWDGLWCYEKHVVNVGLFATFDPECFLKSDPVEQFSALGDLW